MTWGWREKGFMLLPPPEQHDELPWLLEPTREENVGRNQRTRESVNAERAFTFFSAILPQYDWSNNHLVRTPERFVQALRELTTGEEFKFTTFPSNTDEMVIVRDIPVYSLCEHHILPFFGEAHVAYLPDGKIAGLSKLIRSVNHYSKGLWTQEHLTTNIHEHINLHLQPLGTAVVLEARHLCMEMRGTTTPGAVTTTSKMSGVFRDNENQARSEFLRLIKS